MALALSSQNPHDFLQQSKSPLRTPGMDQLHSTRPSLPSISSLIEAVSDQADLANDRSSKVENGQRTSTGSPGLTATPEKPSLVGSPRSYLPPTPELPPPSSFDFPRASPGNTSPSSTTIRNNHYSTPSAIANSEPYPQRTSSYPPIPELSSSYPPIPEGNQWPASQQVRSQAEIKQPETASRPPPISYSEPTVDVNSYPGLSQQRPLPSNFPPPIHGPGIPPIDPQMAPTWQHHHYYPPANPPSYPQPQERYICPTCNKPFSRPSSLKIHTYSHTGEKPYKCKHEGCGKYFSVRSNMKRHEKGCHGGDSAGARASSPKITSRTP